jgi:hypothetical protein
MLKKTAKLLGNIFGVIGRVFSFIFDSITGSSRMEGNLWNNPQTFTQPGKKGTTVNAERLKERLTRYGASPHQKN